MTCAKVVIKETHTGLDVRWGYDEENATSEEMKLTLAICKLVENNLKMLKEAKQ